MRLARTWGLMAVVLSLVAVPAADAAPLRLDTSFGEGGIARAQVKLWNPGGGLTGALRPVRQPDGKVLVAARVERWAGSYSFGQVALARFTRRGALDKTFGRRGRVLIGFHWGSSPVGFSPVTVSVQADGRILLAGSASWLLSPHAQLAIVRLLPDGSRDPAFGANGVVVWNPPWRAGSDWVDVHPGLALPQPDGRLLVAVHVDDGGLRPNLQTSWQRVVLVRFQPDGTVDQSFGQGGFAELDWDGGYFQGWARLPDGRLASVVSRHEQPGESTRESMAWWLHSFTADGSSPAPLRSTGSARLGLDVLDELAELVPTRDGALLMIGTVDVEHERPGTAVRRIRPDGSLDATFGGKCAQPPPRGGSLGGASTPDGGALVTAGDGFGSLAIPYDATGCIAATPLRLRGLAVGPPLLQRSRSALLGATYDVGGLALIKLRR